MIVRVEHNPSPVGKSTKITILERGKEVFWVTYGENGDLCAVFTEGPLEIMESLHGASVSTAGKK